MKQRIKFGEILIANGIITQEQLDHALLAQQGKNKRIGKILVELGYTNEYDIASALSKQLKFPLVDCKDFSVSEELRKIVPKGTAEKKLVLPLAAEDNKLLLAMADPFDFETVEEISFNTGLIVSVAVSSETCILNAIEHYYGSADKIWDLMKEIPEHKDVEFVRGALSVREDKDINVKALFKRSEAPPIIRLVTMVLAEAVESRASDVHFEPSTQNVNIRFRIDGDMRSILKYPKHIHDSVVSRIKIISNLDITNRRLPQDGRSSIRDGEKIVDLRISTLPSAHGETIVIRLLDQSEDLIHLSKLGMTGSVMDALIAAASKPQGTIIVSGPTGSGKSTTLYALLMFLRNEKLNIISVEDPVEYNIEGITQVNVNPAIGYTFAQALRSILRQDPDTILVGEIRDLETAEIAAKAALTGHLVMSTLHANSTVASLTRLLDIGLPSYLVASSISGILAQRLIKRICINCRVTTAPPDNAINGLPPLDQYFKGVGCKLCGNTGYRGRIGVYEYLEIDTKIRRLIARNVPEDEIWAAAIANGTKPLIENAWEKVGAGLTTVEEVLSKVS